MPIIFYDFPLKREIAEKWFDFSDRNDESGLNMRQKVINEGRYASYYHIKICGLHFTEDCFNEFGNLKHGSIPSLKSGSEPRTDPLAIQGNEPNCESSTDPSEIH